MEEPLLLATSQREHNDLAVVHDVSFWNIKEVGGEVCLIKSIFF